LFLGSTWSRRRWTGWQKCGLFFVVFLRRGDDVDGVSVCGGFLLLIETECCGGGVGFFARGG
jgi:hypothetical protein